MPKVAEQKVTLSEEQATNASRSLNAILMPRALGGSLAPSSPPATKPRGSGTATAKGKRKKQTKAPKENYAVI